MTRTRTAADAALPSDRRTFLRGLVTLPLIGGGVTLIGQPTAVAEPVTYDLMQAYKTWLHLEHRRLSHELADHPRMVSYYGGDHFDRYRRIEPLTRSIDVGGAERFHFTEGVQPPSKRAALVLSAVGCDWREEETSRLVDAVRASKSARRQA